MSITPLSAARIAGEVGLAGGTITGGAYAAKYSNQVTVVAGEIDNVRAEKQKIEQQNTEQTETRKNSAETFKSSVQNHYDTLNAYWTQLKGQVRDDNSGYKNVIDNSLNTLHQLLKGYNPQN